MQIPDVMQLTIFSRALELQLPDYNALWLR